MKKSAGPDTFVDALWRVGSTFKAGTFWPPSYLVILLLQND
jgi:hypothetical protein